jgi:ATP-dependent phosphofructokinase / diphosphate-dependent phosphofructokinase
VEFLLNPTALTSSIDGALVCVVNGELQYRKFDDLLDATTKKTSVRTVDITKPSYKIAREYMIRLEREDFEDPQKLAKLAHAASSKDFSVSTEFFKKQFEPVTRLRGGL